MDIQAKIRLLQTLSGKTQSQMAAELDVTFAALNRWVNGKATPRKSMQDKMDKLLSKYWQSVSESSSEIEVKKNHIFALQKAHPRILQKILKRQDLIDEFSLQITYNSNAIEGSTLTQEETREVVFEDRALSRKPLIEQIEAKNHHAAFLFLLEHLRKKNKIDILFMQELHRRLMTNIREDAGKFRIHPVRILGTFVPTANYLKVPLLIDELFLRKISNDVLEFIAKFHADFEKIHPFSDGNGRVGRLLMIANLLQKNIAPAIIQKKKRKNYYLALQKAQLEERYDPITSFTCDAIIEGYRLLE